MGKTIKQLADELNVSKTAIRNYMDEEFRAKYTEKDCKGVIGINDEGCKLIAESIGKQMESDRKLFAETEMCSVPRSVLTTLEEQLRQKDEQLRSKDQQIADLTEAIKSQAQSINVARHNELAGTMKQMLHGEDFVPDKTENKKHFWDRIFNKKER